MTPVARATDPETSWQAADSVLPATITETKRTILEALAMQPAGLTDEELESRVGSLILPFGNMPSPSGLRSRRKELVRDQRVIDSGLRRATRSGRMSIVWRLKT